MYNDIPQYAILAKRGFVVAAMEYRESDLATFPAQVEDVCNALKFIPGIAFVQARVGQCLVKSPGVHVIARRFVLKDIIPEKEIGNVIFDHDVVSLFDDEQVYFQGHSAQIMLPLIESFSTTVQNLAAKRTEEMRILLSMWHRRQM